MYREHVTLGYPFMCMHQIKIPARDDSIREPRKRQRAQKTRKANYRDFVKLDPV